MLLSFIGTMIWERDEMEFFARRETKGVACSLSGRFGVLPIPPSSPLSLSPSLFPCSGAGKGVWEEEEGWGYDWWANVHCFSHLQVLSWFINASGVTSSGQFQPFDARGPQQNGLLYICPHLVFAGRQLDASQMAPINPSKVDLLIPSHLLCPRLPPSVKGTSHQPAAQDKNGGVCLGPVLSSLTPHYGAHRRVLLSHVPPLQMSSPLPGPLFLLPNWCPCF